ncbi:MAG: type II toxin-antitoxin system VapC family toxin [Patescibacteria group bacterium]
MPKGKQPNVAVVDASFVLARLLPGEQKNKKVFDSFDQFESGKIQFVAPMLLKYEVSNVFRTLVTQSRLTPTIATAILEQFLQLDIHYTDCNFSTVLSLAMQNKLTAYDASYLYLARHLRAPLMTLDVKLGAA